MRDDSHRLKTASASWIAFSIALVYCLNVDNLLGYVRLRPVAYQLAGLAAAVVLFSVFTKRPAARRIVALLRSPLIRWLGLLVFFSLPYSLISEPSVASQGLSYLLTTAVVVSTLVLCAEEMTWSRTHTVVLTLTVVTACLSVIVDPLVDFRQYVPGLADEGYERTRAAGLFLQPNAASMALAFLLALAIPRVSRPARVLLSCLVAAAVFLTFSRSGFVLLALILFLSAWRGLLPRNLLLAVAVTGLVWTTTSVKDVIVETFKIDQGSGYVRLIHLQDMLTSSALLNDSRASTAEQGYSDFLDNPLGQGLGYSWRWAEMQSDQQGTHNQSLRYMLEYGLAGALVWPLFLVAIFRSRNRQLDSVWALGVCLCGFVASLFSHNLSESGSFLVPLMASLVWPSTQPTLWARRRAEPPLLETVITA